MTYWFVWHLWCWLQWVRNIWNKYNKHIYKKGRLQGRRGKLWELKMMSELCQYMYWNNLTFTPSHWFNIISFLLPHIHLIHFCFNSARPSSPMDTKSEKSSATMMTGMSVTTQGTALHSSKHSGSSHSKGNKGMPEAFVSLQLEKVMS